MYTADKQEGVDLIKDENGTVVAKSFKPSFTETILDILNPQEEVKEPEESESPEKPYYDTEENKAVGVDPQLEEKESHVLNK